MMTASNVRTRFAPSPTGYMHIGGMRTALFNWLFARHHGGQFILRIDDTDQQRNVDETLEPILQAFRWLELDWDEGPEVGGEYGPYYQSQRADLYQQAVGKLLATGKAFRDFDPPELTQQDRQAAEKEKRPFLNIRRSLELSDQQIEEYLVKGRNYVIRFQVPREEKIELDDAIRGHVEWDCNLIADPVIVRGNGAPLYHFATVIDDAQMQISHVIRAEEHLSNTPIQLLLHQALEHPLPVYAHIPYVAAPGAKEKLSKRDKKIEKYRKNPQFKKLFEMADTIFPLIGLRSSESLNPVMVAYYEQIGFLPEAVFNALSRLGWSLDDQTEILSRETVIENFSLERVIKSPAGLDPDKLFSFQLHWISEFSPADMKARLLPYLLKANWISDPVSAETDAFLDKLILALGERIKVFSDILEYPEFFLADDQLQYDEKEVTKLSQKTNAKQLLANFQQMLAEVEPFNAETTEPSMKAFVEQSEIKLGEIMKPMRIALTGKATGPALFDTMELLGQETCLRRMSRLTEQL